MRRKMSIFLIMILCLSMIFSGCSYGTSADDELREGAEEPVKEEATAVGEEFDSAIDPGLYYTVKDCQIFDDLAAAGISSEQMEFIENSYADTEYQGLEVKDLVTSDGTIDDRFSFVCLTLDMENKNAEGFEKKDEFSVSNISLTDENNENLYRVAYFSEAGKVDDVQTLYYKLPQGDKMTVQIGYLVLKDSVDSLYGFIEGTEDPSPFLIQ